MLAKNWYTKSKETLNDTDRLQSIINTLLTNRNLVEEKDKGLFFSPLDCTQITLSEAELDEKEVSKAIKRLQSALKNKDKVVIYGDYDADGVTATAILWETLYHLGFDVKPFLPHREEHGYGLKPKGIEAMIAENGKPGLMITVDNGIVAFEGAAYCKENGIDLIICDHHEPQTSEKQGSKKTILPDALAVVHSTKTAGAGVAFILAKEILTAFEKECDTNFLNSLIELATIGVVADIVPLLSVSRQIVKQGLSLVPKTTRPGLKALFAEANLKDTSSLSTYHIGFVIAPRINATGRLQHCLDSLRLLCTKDESRAMQLAVDLGAINKQRQDMTFASTQEALKVFKDIHTKQKILITASEKYNPGVIGLIAGKITEQFYKPAIAIATMGEYAKGSARSVPGVNIIEMLRALKGDFTELGGHPMAAGFTIKTDQFESVKEKLETLAQSTISDELLVPLLSAEMEIYLSDITFDLFNEIQRFAPFGIGNPQPVFISRYVEAAGVYPLGKDQKHLKILVKQPALMQSSVQATQTYEAVFFSGGDYSAAIKRGALIDIAYQIDLNVWNGSRKLQLILKDVKLSA